MGTTYTAEIIELDGEYILQFPEDFDYFKEGDLVEWIDNKDGTWSLRKVNMDFVDKVSKFNEIGGIKNEFDARKVALYIGLQAEEFAEKIKINWCT